MPRNSSGTYTLPAGNPVVSGTVISSVWANTTLSDLGTAITDSLSRSGDGAMLAPLELVDGVVGAPGLTWGTETTSGWYRAAAGDFRFSISSTNVFTIQGNQVLHRDGAVGNPGISFIADSDNGMYRIGSDNVGLAAGGVLNFSFTASAISFAQRATFSGTNPPLILRNSGAPANEGYHQLQVSSGGAFIISSATDASPGSAVTNAISLSRNGTAWDAIQFGNATDNPPYTFLGSGSVTIGGNVTISNADPVFNLTDTGAAVDERRWALNSANGPFIIYAVTDGGLFSPAMTLGRTGGTATTVSFPGAGALSNGGVFLGPNGAVGAPTYSFTSDTNTGMYRAAASTIGFAAAGASVMSVGSTEVTVVQPFKVNNGTAANPSYSFNADPNTGFFASGSDDVRVTCGGVTKAGFFNGATVLGLCANDASGDTRLAFYESNAFAVVKGFVGYNGAADDVFSVVNSENATMVFGTNNTTRLTIAADGSTLTSTPVHIGPDGTAGAPTYSFTSDPDTGIHWVQSGRINFSCNGVVKAAIDNAASTLLLTANDASGDVFIAFYESNSFAARKGYVGYFAAATDVMSVMNEENANIELGTNNTVRVTISTSLITNTLVQRGPAGLASGPTYGFSSEVDTGIYWNSAGDFRASVLSNAVFSWVAAASGGAKVADFGGTLQTVGFRHIPQNSQSANYTLVLADSGKHIYHPSGGGAGDTFTIPANSSVAYDLGTVLTFINSDSNSVSIAITTDTMTLAGTTTTGTRTLAQNGVATATKVTTTSWIISGTGLT